MFVFNKKPFTLMAPVEGTLKSIEHTPESNFAKKAMGDGFVIFPKTGKVVAPFDGEVKFIFPNKQAIGLESKNKKIEILIHIGIDTGLLNGEGFEVLVKENQKVKANEPLILFDIDYLEKNSTSTAVPIVFVKLDDQKLSFEEKEVNFNEVIATIE